MQETIETREQDESNTLSQNKENIYALNNNIALQINKYLYCWFILWKSFNSNEFDLLSIITLHLIKKINNI